VKAEKVREMSEDELERKEEELHEQLFRMRMQKATGQLDQPVKIRGVRKDLARVKTRRTELRQESRERSR